MSGSDAKVSVGRRVGKKEELVGFMEAIRGELRTGARVRERR